MLIFSSSLIKRTFSSSIVLFVLNLRWNSFHSWKAPKWLLVFSCDDSITYLFFQSFTTSLHTEALLSLENSLQQKQNTASLKSEYCTPGWDILSPLISFFLYYTLENFLLLQSKGKLTCFTCSGPCSTRSDLHDPKKHPKFHGRWNLKRVQIHLYSCPYHYFCAYFLFREINKGSYKVRIVCLFYHIIICTFSGFRLLRVWTKILLEWAYFLH